MNSYIENIGSKVRTCIYIVLISVFLAGCADSNSEAVNIGELFPSFSVYDLAGKEVLVPSQFKATKHLISIRTLGCRFCKSDFAELEKLYQFYSREELDIFVINVGFEKKAVEEFLSDKTISFTVLIDETLVSMKQTHNTTLPVVYLLDSNNMIFSRIKGGFSFEEIKYELDHYK